MILAVKDEIGNRADIPYYEDGEVVDENAKINDLNDILMGSICNNTSFAFDWLEQVRWKGKPTVCPLCGSTKRQIPTRRAKNENYFKCSGCDGVYTVRSNTIFHKSRGEVGALIYAAYVLVTSRTGISSIELAQRLGVTPETALGFLRKIRECCGFDVERDGKMCGNIEIDETYVGGKESNRHFFKKANRGRGAADKIPVVGFYCRETGESRAFVVPEVNQKTVHALIKKWIAVGSILYTDESHVYDGIEFEYVRQRVNHNRREYSEREVTTNRIESVWAALKRPISGAWFHLTLEHIQGYINEECFRLNRARVNVPISKRLDELLRVTLNSNRAKLDEISRKNRAAIKTAKRRTKQEFKFSA